MNDTVNISYLPWESLKRLEVGQKVRAVGGAEGIWCGIKRDRDLVVAWGDSIARAPDGQAYIDQLVAYAKR
jgi:hypothetical protein